MMSFKFLRGAAVAGLAMMAMIAGSSPSFARVDELGMRSSKIDSGDQAISKEVKASSAPTEGAASVTVTQTVRYLHKRWFWQNDQSYAIPYNGSADYVGRLGYWMYKDGDGSLYRFNKGSPVGIETKKPTVDIGELPARMSDNDSGTVSSVKAPYGTADVPTRPLNVVTRYRHIETYDDLSYTVASSVDASYVPNQNAHMVYVGNTLYKIERSGEVHALSEKPVSYVGNRPYKISENDSLLSYDPTVSAGAVSFNGRNRAINVSREYIHEETYEKQRYSIDTELSANFVPEQNAHMIWIDNRLYRVRVGSDDVVQLSSKPVVNAGSLFYKIDSNDSLVNVEVLPYSLTSDNRAIFVRVRHYWRHSETYQIKEYYGESTEIARYNDNYHVWTVIVDGRIYAIAYDGDVINDSGVVVVKAPGNMRHPDQIVVKPNKDDPPVVVPGKNNPPAPDNSDDDPPVVVPGKSKPPIVVHTDDDPPVVVPRH